MVDLYILAFFPHGKYHIYGNQSLEYMAGRDEGG
jgi:hypothetical protein